jgi:uncharacterized protein YndB with AHSA1/START domain
MSVEPIAPYLEPVRKSVHVDRPPDEAFAVFTTGLGRWWPLASHSLGQARAVTCVMEERAGGAIYETNDAGERFPWGQVVTWEPPRRIVMTWHPGQPPEAAQEVEVRFSPDGGGTRVELEHRGWQKLGQRAAESRDAYDHGWVDVLGVHFARACGKETRA